MLEFSSVTYTYPHAAAPAVRDVSFRLAPGEALLCTGRSGCGKSTLIRLANGLAPHYLRGELRGEVRAAGRNTLGVPPAELAVGVGTLFQDPERQFFALSVGEELALSLQWRGWEPEAVRAAVAESARALGIESLLDQTIFGLSEGQKQKVALASLLASRPGLLVLDEPTANLDPESARDLSRTLAGLKNQGVALFIVDHRLHWARDLADRVLVLDNGSVAARGDFSLLEDAELGKRHGLRAAAVEDARESLPVLGEPCAAAFSREARSEEPAFFACEELAFAYPEGRPLFAGASFRFSPGRIIALVGGNGAGKTTLARLLTGLERPQGGRILVQGRPVKARRLARHAQVVLQNAGHQLRMGSVRAELDDAAHGVFAPSARPAAVDSCMEAYGLAPLAGRHPQSLSGGEKQRLAVACAAIRRPRMLVLDEPTSGLDGENMRRMAENMALAAADGACLLVITHDLELLRLVCTEKIVLQTPEENARSGGKTEER
ncbi:MAG: ATP-binding cassette domain-containing protein [Deltaproteobacteria bacterium]|jgi:energy-coupling factor transport system ATP-binding protein|nr:ATP-binding cassette domain-containing protein [Deltaproteobacteria bacterium]